MGSTNLGMVLVFVSVMTPVAWSAEDKSFNSGGVKIHYSEEGKGETIVLLHGFGNNRTDWDRKGLVVRLAKNFRVVTVDLRGHGKSEKPIETKLYGQEMVEDIVRLLDHLEVPRAHVVGLSLGAAITAKLVATHPKRVRSAVLIAGGFAPITPEQRKKIDRLAQEIEEGKGPALLVDDYLSPPGRPPLSEEQRLGLALAFNLSQNIKAVAAQVRGWPDLAVTFTEAKTNQVPVLALVGSLDRAGEFLRGLKEIMPAMQLITIEGATHGGILKHPDVLKELIQFLTVPRKQNQDSSQKP